MGKSTEKEYEIRNPFIIGNQEEFSCIFRLYYVPLCNYAQTFVKFADIAEDIVQETFIKIWEDRQNIHIETSLRAYLYKSVHNNCISFIRHLKVDNKHSKEIIYEINYHFEIANRNYTQQTTDDLISEETVALLNKTIDEFPEQCKCIYLLRNTEHLSYPEIAQKLNISINTVKTQLSRAYAKLRKEFSRNENF